MDRARPTIFLPKPMPERIFQASFSSDLMPKHPLLTLSVGLSVRTEDLHGLKLAAPATMVAVAIGEVSGDQEKMVFDLDLKSARSIAKRMIQMCDAAEKGEPYAA